MTFHLFMALPTLPATNLDLLKISRCGTTASDRILHLSEPLGIGIWPTSLMYTLPIAAFSFQPRTKMAKPSKNSSGYRDSDTHIFSVRIGHTGASDGGTWSPP